MRREGAGIITLQQLVHGGTRVCLVEKHNGRLGFPRGWARPKIDQCPKDKAVMEWVEETGLCPYRAPITGLQKWRLQIPSVNPSFQRERVIPAETRTCHIGSYGNSRTGVNKIELSTNVAISIPSLEIWKYFGTIRELQNMRFSGSIFVYVEVVQNFPGIARPQFF